MSVVAFVAGISTVSYAASGTGDRIVVAWTVGVYVVLNMLVLGLAVLALATIMRRAPGAVTVAVLAIVVRRVPVSGQARMA
jgi:hypothetical protein